MEDKKLNRVFDRVKLSQEREDAILADLLREKKEVSSMKQKRRIPAAALVAAVLVAALAGTAVASEYFGKTWVTKHYGGVTGGDGNKLDGYSIHGEYEYIPEETLPEEVRALGQEFTSYGAVYRPFDSRSECEAFLRLELAKNSKLEELPPNAVLDLSNLDPEWGGPVSNGVEIAFTDRGAATIFVWSYYGEDNWYFHEQATFHTDKSGSIDSQVGIQPGWTVTSDSYVTPNGLEAAIMTETNEDGSVMHRAYFASGNALYQLDFLTWAEQSGIDGLSALKEILDAYE